MELKTATLLTKNFRLSSESQSTSFREADGAAAPAPAPVPVPPAAAADVEASPLCRIVAADATSPPACLPIPAAPIAPARLLPPHASPPRLPPVQITAMTNQFKREGREGAAEGPSLGVVLGPSGGMSFAQPKRPPRQRRELPPPVGGVAAGNQRPRPADAAGAAHAKRRPGDAAAAKVQSRRPAAEGAKARAVGGARRKILAGGAQKRGNGRNGGDAEEDEKAKYLAELSTSSAHTRRTQRAAGASADRACPILTATVVLPRAAAGRPQRDRRRRRRGCLIGSEPRSRNWCGPRRPIDAPPSAYATCAPDGHPLTRDRQRHLRRPWHRVARPARRLTVPTSRRSRRLRRSASIATGAGTTTTRSTC